MAKEPLGCRVDEELVQQISPYVKGRFNGNKSEFVRAAIEAYVQQNEAEMAAIPEDVVVGIEFLAQVILTSQDLTRDKKFISEEVARIWQMVSSQQSISK